MFERFTDRARRVVVLAQEEARLLDHNYIGTEHILLGLIHEGEGVATRVLTGLDISLEKVRAEVEEIIGRGGPAPAGHIPFTPRSKKVLEMSLREALRLGHNYIGTEHILLGLIREGTGVAAQVLTKLDADHARVQQAVIQELSEYSEQGEEPPTIVSLEERLEADSPILAARSGIQPARCGFCGVPSPECGPLFTGVSATLICTACARVAAGLPATRAAWRAATPPGGGAAFPGRTEYPDRLEVLASFHQPVGPPPDDEEAARRAIEYAFTDPMELSADGTTLVNVEDGTALRPYADQLTHPVRAFIAGRENVIELIKFIDAKRAAVWTTTRLRNSDPPSVKIYQEGWAVLVGGRWKMSRETIRERWAQAGVTTPPAPPG